MNTIIKPIPPCNQDLVDSKHKVVKIIYVDLNHSIIMNFLDNITDMAKNAMAKVTGNPNASTVIASLTKIAEEIQANPKSLIQNPTEIVEKLKNSLPEGFDMSQLPSMVASLPISSEIKDGLTKLVDMASRTTAQVSAKVEENITSKIPGRL